MRGRKSSLVVTLSPQERQVLEYRLRCTDHTPGTGSPLSGDPGRRRRPVPGRSRATRRLDREACSQVGPTVPRPTHRGPERSAGARTQARLFPPRWPCTPSRSPVSGPTSGAARCRSGTAPRSPASWSVAASSRASRSSRCGRCCCTTASSPGGMRCGSPGVTSD